MKLDNILLQKLEKLSHLTIEDDKRDEIISQLSDIVEYVESLSELDTSDIDSHFSTLTGGTLLREDNPLNSNAISELIIDKAPETKDNFFIVPAIIEG